MSASDKSYELQEDGDILIVLPTSDQIGFKQSQLQTETTAIVKQLDGGAILHLVFDADNADFLSSAVIGSMIQMWEAAEEKGGRFVSCNISDGALEALVAMRLDTKWRRYDSRDEALKALRQTS